MDLTEEAARLCEDAEEGKAEDVAIAPETDLQVGSVDVSALTLFNTIE